MNNDTTKISFIPQSPLVKKAGALAGQKRPVSILMVLAILAFILSAGSYGALYVYKASLISKIKQNTEKITQARDTLQNSPVIAQAKVFRERAMLGKALLDAHIVVSPIFTFLEDDTLQTVMYSQLTFTNKAGELKVAIKGEAPGYASLAYQSDVLKEEKSTLKDFVIKDVTLMPSGSVGFTLEGVFHPASLLYTEIQSGGGEEGVSADPAKSSAASTVEDISSSSFSSDMVGDVDPLSVGGSKTN
ncbi:MAG: hypothetical protein UY07_C0012G0005 [Parcubacteria group bacterium GW2011_GWA1_47_8]|nr:MAG: hypothetical protein UY07_C0012G0005 [Parcubacteria group bacterium GW2011_GWA1_47_8]KKW07753.1 MAG: hypothetical protein UY42_C0007G0020 [Parcubacteria group bacterium GW2011_GWA2_49_16]